MNKKFILLAVLIVLALSSLFYGVRTSTNEKDRSARKPHSVQTEEPAVHTVSGPHERRARKSAYLSWGRNPFQPPEAKPQAKAPRLNLNGIAWDEKNPLAIINDHIIGAGAQVGGYRVVKVLEDRVIMSDGSNEFELRRGQ